MRLLFTSDLHLDGKKLLWLLDEAPEHDALLDIFSSTNLTEQKSGALRWKATFLKSGKSRNRRRLAVTASCQPLML